MASILVADDDPGVLGYLETVLKHEGHDVTTAKDGLEAMLTWKSGTFDLLVIDVHMPKLTGLEVLDKLAADGRPARAIVLTGDDTPDVVLGAAARQAARFIAKPVLPAALTSHVAAALARRPCGRPLRVISAKRDWVEIVVPCDLDAVDQVQSFLLQLDADLTPEMREAIGQAFHELLRNAIEWGGGNEPGRDVRIAYLRTRRMVMYRIADPGPGFKFEELEHAAMAHDAPGDLSHVEAREEKGIRPGGFGILMTRSLVDELIYNQAQNEVIFIKNLDAAGPKS